MTLNEFKVSRFCVPLVLPDEEQPQDVKEWRRLQNEDAERQYRVWQVRNGVVESSSETDEEKRVKAQLDRLAKKNLPVPVLAEPEPSTRPTDRNRRVGGEARESTTRHLAEKSVAASENNSRGGQNAQQKWRKKNKEKLAEYMRLWRAAEKLKKAKTK